jgi:hypothetical protein
MQNLFAIIDDLLDEGSIYSKLSGRSQRPVMWFLALHPDEPSDVRRQHDGRHLKTRDMFSLIDTTLRNRGYDPSHSTVNAILTRMDSDERFRTHPAQRRDFRAELSELFEFAEGAKIATSYARDLIRERITDPGYAIEWLDQNHYADKARVRHNGQPVRAYVGLRLRAAEAKPAPVTAAVKPTLAYSGPIPDALVFRTREDAQRTFDELLKSLVQPMNRNLYRAEKIVASLLAFSGFLRSKSEIKAEVALFLRTTGRRQDEIESILHIAQQKAPTHRFEPYVRTLAA